MREVRVTVPVERAGAVVEIALRSGIGQATVYEVYVHGIDAPRQVISVETSTPAAKRFVDALSAESYFDPAQYTVTTRDLRSLVSGEKASNITVPIVAPEPDVIDELWQSSHVTRSYVGRTGIAAVLLAYAMIHNAVLLMVAALLFMPFLSHALAIGLGAWTREWRLAVQGTLAFAIGAAITVSAGAAVAAASDAPFRFDTFAPLPVSVLISLGIGVAAGLASVDDAARRPLVGLAAASQFAIYPVWFGIFLVRGFDETSDVSMRLLTMSLNVVTIIASATLAYALIGMHHTGIARLSRSFPRSSGHAREAAREAHR